jgi:tRNA-dihydrouridine synthase B
MSITIGPATLADPVILAPMSGVTDQPFRRLVRRLGVGLVVSEMIASEAMIRQTRQSMLMARQELDEQPAALQLAGCEPRVMAEAAKLNEDLGARIIDINMGCPVKKVVNGWAGSALMRDEDKAARIIEATAKAVSVPVTLKMRTGWDLQSRNAPRLARIAEATGAQMITVHGRTRNQMFAGKADWRFIREVKAATRLPVIANGDVETLDDAAEILRQSGADGVMIGRGCYGRPWFPGQVVQFLRTGERRPDPSLIEQWRLLREHYEAMLLHYGRDIGLRIARKHVSWYVKGLPGAAQFRNEVVRIEQPEQVVERIDRFYAPALAQDRDWAA